MITALALAGLVASDPVTVDFAPSPAGFALIAAGKPAAVYVDADAEKPVARVAADFASDLEKVSGSAPTVIHDLKGVKGNVVIIGEIGHSPLIDGLIKAGKLHADAVSGQWEAYDQAVVDHPAPGVDKALVIAGADRRGAVYGTYDISAKMGVSPWYWWADVPVEHRREVYVSPGERHDQPVVKYRGFFINDEDPAFGGWAKEKFGGVNHLAYAHVFELLLRLKGDYLWPAMWGKSIADDDPQSLDTADEYGVVLGTSHHEPMTRAQEEWHRHKDGGITGGAWDYTTNAANLRAFWKGGIERMVKGGHEDVVTVGMRGDGDKPMSEGTATQLLEQIVADQRQIIADVTGKPADQTPQIWALYKEVQDYYDHGMKVPDDVTLLFSDDNWGQIRRLPDLTAKPRSGGYGIYYHFDYVGGPRNYKWIDTNQIEKVWQQMDLAYETGADHLWIFNVGDIKPMEYPLSFALDMAWNPKAMTPDALHAYPARWAAQQFGPAHAAEIGDMLTRYSKYAARKKPELIDAGTFDMMPSRPDEGVRDRLLELARQSQSLNARLEPAQQPAWTELAGYEIAALDNLYGLYGDVAQNRFFARQNEPVANLFAERAKADFARDRMLAAEYNGLLDGKWDHMMDQTHIGYTYWQQPETQVMPEVTTVPGATPQLPHLGSVRVHADPPRPGGRYADRGGYISIEAGHFARQVDGPDTQWRVIPDLGRTLSSVIAYPQAAAPSDGHSMRLEYDIVLAHEVDTTLNLYLAPTLDTAGKGGLRLAVGIDDQTPQVLSFDLKPDRPDWSQAVKDNVVILKAAFNSLKAGPHTIKFYRIDGNVVLEKLVLDTGGLKPAYLGPPESGTVP
ncbi:MAG: glycosyl hydrolase 115 family protein [Asticcacaulis sp.]